MTDQMIKELSCRINRSKLNEVLLKSEALLYVAMNSELQSTPAYIIHDYLWVLSDLLTDARKSL